MEMTSISSRAEVTILSPVVVTSHISSLCSLTSLVTRMVSSSIVADIRGLIEACFVTNLDWYDKYKLRPRDINNTPWISLMDSLTVRPQERPT